MLCAVGDGSGAAAVAHVPTRLPSDQEAHRRPHQQRLSGKGLWSTEHLPLSSLALPALAMQDCSRGNPKRGFAF